MNWSSEESLQSLSPPLSHESTASQTGSLQSSITSHFQLLNKTTEFDVAVRRVLTDVRLDNDIVVSVFETNIRVLG